MSPSDDDEGSARVRSAPAERGVAALREEQHALLVTLAHDLRNPLAPLSNGLELLRLTDADAAGRLRTRGILERQVVQLMRIADQLSEFARLVGPEPGLSSNHGTVAALMRDVAERARPALERHELLLSADVRQGDAVLHGDLQRLAEGLARLLEDLARQCERGSGIRLSAHAEGAQALVVIEPEAQAAAWQDASPASLGLGAALAQRLAELHGGSLRARRMAAGKRARFEVRLPLASVPAGSDSSGVGGEPAEPRSPAAGASLAVLVADDNVDFSHSFRTMLELLGHRVEVVHDGLAAVAAIVAAPPDVAFIDLGMPALDGFHAVQRVRALEHAAGAMLVAVTGRGGAEDRARAAQCGFDRYLVKPFSMQDVRNALDEAQARRATGD